MGKETREKARNQRNSAPYNVSNSSFAKRITSKVAEYIPSSWVSGWFEGTEENEGYTPTSNPNSTQVQVEINHVDTISSGSKTTSIPNHNNVGSNSNNRTSFGPSKSHVLGNETCSPILNSDRHPRDYQAAGPSGFSQPSKPTHNLFVASTPAFIPNKLPSGNGDNGSESGESTSGCSSLVSQSNKLRVGGGLDLGKSKSLFPNRQIPTEEITKSHNKSSGPQFDTSLFNTSSPSLNKSVNLSPFYPGRTMYGGASTYRKYSLGSNKSTTSPSVFQPSLRRTSLCNQSKVNPSPTTLPKMSIVAENILKTINAMTPVTRLMTMPRPEEVNASPASLRGAAMGNGVKRKLPELQIPTVVNTNLIQLKGSERKNVLSQSIQEVLSSSSSDEDLDYSLVSNDAKRSLKEKMKRARRGKSRNEEVQTEAESQVNLPNAVLNVSTLPVIDIPLVQPNKPEPCLDISFSDPIECRNFNISSETSLLSVSSNQDSDVNNTSVNFVYNSEPSKPKPRTSITLPPVEALPNQNLSNVLNKSNVDNSGEQLKSAATSWKCDICLNKHNSGSICTSCGMPKTTKELESIKSSNDLSKNTQGSTTTKPLSESFKPAADTWECSACCVRNKAGVDTCVCCTTPKPGAKPSAPTPSMTISSSSTVGGGFGDLFKKPSGNWECPACMISNKSADDKCVACETAKPGAKPAATPAASKAMSGPKFPFATSSDSAPSFKFGIDKVDAKTSSSSDVLKPVVSTSSATPTFSFGVPPASTSAQSASTPLPAFSFGMPKAQDSSADKKETSSAPSPSLTFTSTSNSLVNSMSSKQEKPPTSTPTPTPAPSFMFKSSDSVSSASDTKTTAAATVPTFSFASPASSASELKTNSISTTSFSFGTTNGPITKLETPKPVEVKSPNTTTEVKESPKPSLFGSTPSFLSNNSTNSQKPLTSLFGQSHTAAPALVNNTEPNKPLTNAFDDKKVTFNLTPSNGEQPPPSKMIDFGKPAVTSEPAKPNIFGAAVFEKPKENNIFAFGSSNSNNTLNSNPPPVNNAAPPPAFPSKPEANVFTFGTTSKPVNNAFPIQQTTPSANVFSFGSSSSTPQQPNAQPTPSFASPSPAPAFSFGATNSNTPNFNSVSAQPPAPAQQTVSLFGNAAPAGGNVFGNPAQPATTPMFGGGFNQPAAPTPAATPFTFGAPTNNASAGFSFGNQNAAPASNTGFSFGGPAAPPTFDPQIRPNFNFTSGPAPTFSAQPGNASSIGARRIKKAVRRK
ncbi:hypothetical protein M8J75_013990 [Diaphorina citri]|nr:hypothetical protein M8J75_013990 [Diaphorina citri]